MDIVVLMLLFYLIRYDRKSMEKTWFERPDPKTEIPLNTTGKRRGEL
jgi:hypothetical protein